MEGKTTTEGLGTGRRTGHPVLGSDSSSDDEVTCKREVRKRDKTSLNVASPGPTGPSSRRPDQGRGSTLEVRLTESVVTSAGPVAILRTTRRTSSLPLSLPRLLCPHTTRSDGNKEGRSETRDVRPGVFLEVGFLQPKVVSSSLWSIDHPS